MSTSAPSADARYYRPRGRLVGAWTARAREVITDGPAGTGKSRMWLERGHALAQRFPGSRGLIVRKTRASLTESALVTFEQKVLPPNLPWVTNQQRDHRQAYHLPNGSVIVVGGLDKPERLFSTEYDWIYVMEATELDEPEWESLLRALRNHVVPYQQLVGDCNPAGSMHWILQRARAGRLALVTSRHEDNPEYWDEAAADWTPAGRHYMTILDGLTGVRYKRLRQGLWVAAENIVYEDWDPAIHVVDRFPIPASWPRYLAIDFGLSNPFCCQWWAVDPDGRLVLYRELYGTQILVKDWAHRIYDLSEGEHITDVICDHDVEGRAEIELHSTHGAGACPIDDEQPSWSWSGLPTRPTTAAQKDVSRGIQKVGERLQKAGDGQPRLFLQRDAIVQRDPRLLERKKPTCTQDEFEGYVWEQRNTQQYGRVIMDAPLKHDDHGMDPLRYMVMHLDGETTTLDDVYGLSTQMSVSLR